LLLSPRASGMCGRSQSNVKQGAPGALSIGRGARWFHGCFQYFAPIPESAALIRARGRRHRGLCIRNQESRIKWCCLIP